MAGNAAQTPTTRSGVPNVDNLALRYMLANTMIRLEQITFAVRKSQILHHEEPWARRCWPACIFTTPPRARPGPARAKIINPDPNHQPELRAHRSGSRRPQQVGAGGRVTPHTSMSFVAMIF